MQMCTTLITDIDVAIVDKLKRFLQNNLKIRILVSQVFNTNKYIMQPRLLLNTYYRISTLMQRVAFFTFK